jgi:hypothetical protein
VGRRELARRRPATPIASAPLRLPDPMLSRSDPSPGWSFEVKWDGFRAIAWRCSRLRGDRGGSLVAVLLPRESDRPSDAEFAAQTASSARRQTRT